MRRDFEKRAHDKWASWHNRHPHPNWRERQALRESFHHHPRPYRARKARGGLFLRLLVAFGLMAILGVGGLAGIAWLLSRLMKGDGPTTLLLWMLAVGASMALPLLVGVLALRVYRSIAVPLADVMAAADAVAEGDLGTRVEAPSRAPEPFRRLARSFNRMVEKLQRADTQRRQLTADVAHELRTPLQIVQGNLEGIIDGVYEPSETHVHSTLEEVSRLGRLIEDLQTLSLAETGSLPMTVEDVCVSDLLHDTVTSFGGQAEAMAIELKVDGSVSRSTTARGDGGRLSQVLSNLVANALRFTPSGGTITLSAQEHVDRVRIVVSDTGNGIASEDLPYVFDRFWKGDKARVRSSGSGSGLGLAICRELIAAQGGSISVQSTLGQGTAFTIDLSSSESP